MAADGQRETEADWKFGRNLRPRKSTGPLPDRASARSRRNLPLRQAKGTSLDSSGAAAPRASSRWLCSLA